MIKKLSNWLNKVSTGWLTLAAVLVFFLFTALVLPGQAAQADEHSAGAGTPDLSLFYTPDDLYTWAEAYGEAGRSEYVRARFTFDLAWPLVYGFFLVTLLSWLFQRAFPPGSSWRLANLAPLAGVLLDYLENIASSLVMLRYPQLTYGIDWLAAIFTPLKWLFVGGSFVLLLVGFGAWIWHQVRART